MNYYTSGNYILHPWGYVSYIYSHDRNLFQTYRNLFTTKNHHPYDNPDSLIYLVNGDSNDLTYGDLNTKPKCIAFTPEIGSAEDGFWPGIERIIPYCIESPHQNLEAAKLAGEYILSADISPFSIATPNGYIKFSLH